MRAKHRRAWADACGGPGCPGRGAAGAGPGQHLRSAVHLPHRPVRRLRHSDRERHASTTSTCSTSATAASAASSSSIEECETGYDTKKGVECYESVKSKKPVDHRTRSRPASRCSSSPRPRSTRSRSCRWPMALSASAVGNDLPLGVQSAGDLLGRRFDDRQIHRRQGRRPRQAQGQEDRLHLSRRAATARSRSRCSSSSPRITASKLKLYPVAGAGDAEPVGAVAQRAPRPAGLDRSCRAGAP